MSSLWSNIWRSRNVERVDNTKRCNWTKVVRFTDDDVIKAVSSLMKEPVRVVLIAAICTNQPHPEEGIHQMVIVCGEGNKMEASFLLKELTDAVFR
jgi:hypothetical protein